MGGKKNEVTLTFAGDSDQLERAFAKVGAAADDMATEVGKASKDVARSAGAFDTVGDGAGRMDTRMMGVRDGVTGVQDSFKGIGQLMQGNLSEGIFNTAAGFGDLASSVENLVVPLAKTVGAWVAGHASMAFAAVSSVATQIASWVALGVTSLISAAQVAAAWLLSVWPIALVIAAVVGLAYLIYRNWDTIKEVIGAGWRWVAETSSKLWDGIKSVVGSAIGAVVSTIQRQIDLVKSIFSTIKGAVVSALSGVADAFLAPFKNAFGGIKSLWNSTVGGKGFDIPSWVPGIGGKSFTIPKLAAGGIVTEPTLALIGEAGPEAVVPLSHGSGFAQGGTTVVEFRSSGSRLDDMLVEIMRQAVKTRGGVQVVFS